MSQPYISIDIETTGIRDQAEILQIAAVFDDLYTPINQLLKLDLPIKHEVMNHCEPYAIGMNADLFKKMMEPNFETYTPDQAISKLLIFMHEAIKLSGNDEKQKPRKVIFAGKNVASFDIPKIKAFIEKHTKSHYQQQQFLEMTHYKTLDVGSLYYDVFKDNVSLSKINELTGRLAVSHNALDDALDVVHAIRHKLGSK